MGVRVGGLTCSVVVATIWDEGDGRWERNCKTHTTLLKTLKTYARRDCVFVLCKHDLTFQVTQSFAVAATASALAYDEYI